MKKITRKDDDLFNNSSMTLGEHLMELRRCVIFAVLWLTGGFLIALIPIGSSPSLASRAVSFIQRPLKRALETFYVDQSSGKLQKDRALLEKYDYPPEIAEVPLRQHMTPREFWIFPGDRHRLNTLFPDKASQQTSPETTAVSSSHWQGEPELLILWEKLEGDPRIRTKALSMPETFVIFIKAALFVGLVIASPGVCYSFWSFVAAGLHPEERRLVYRFLPSSLFLFISGFCLAFFVVFELVLKFLLRFNSGMSIDPDPRITEWLNFALLLPVGFGIAFQLPLVMFACYRLRIFKLEDYIHRWKLAVLVIAFLSMMLTPPDPGSMICMMTPLIGLYFGGVVLCRCFPCPPLPNYDDEDDEDDDSKDGPDKDGSGNGKSGKDQSDKGENREAPKEKSDTRPDAKTGTRSDAKTDARAGKKTASKAKQKKAGPSGS